MNRSGPDIVGNCPSEARDGVTLKDVFSNARRAAETSAWLDEIFNGDFLPLPLQRPGISTDDRPRQPLRPVGSFHLPILTTAPNPTKSNLCI